MLGQVGSDQEGKSYIEFLKKIGINHDLINELPDTVTGQAYILSHKKTKDNSIIIIGGANQKYDPNADLPLEWVDSIKNSGILLLQREIPEHVNIKAA
jgi:ribokinase